MEAESLFVVIPAYNEVDSIIDVVLGWYPVVDAHGGDGSRLVIVCDGSADGTYEVACELAVTRPKMEVLFKENGGHGSAVMFGYEHAMASGARWVFQTDADLQTLPSEFDAFWNAREGHACVIGVRRSRGDGASRAFVERVLCVMLKVAFGVSVEDSNCPFRLMSADALGKWMRFLPEGYEIPNAVLTALFVRGGEDVLFLPVTFLARPRGEGSVNVRRILGYGVRAMRDFLRIRRAVGAK